MTMDQKFLLEVSMYKLQINKLMEMDRNGHTHLNFQDQ